LERDSFHLVQRAWAAYQAKHYEVAEREAQAALAIEPNEPNALSVLSLCAMTRNDQSGAIELGEQARAHAPEEPIYHYRLARIHAWFGDHRQAELPLDKTLALDPTFAPAYSLYAWVYYARGHLDIALRAIHEALKFDPHEEYALTLRIELLKEKGSRKLAEVAAREALAVNPENNRAHAMAGVIKIESRDRESGIAHLSEAMRLDPSSQWVRRRYAQALEERGFLARSISRASTLLTHSPMVLIVVWAIPWIGYLGHRQEYGPAITWRWSEFLLALMLHVLLVVAWWGPLFSYFLMRDASARRVIATELGLRQRTRFNRPWHVCVSCAILLSILSLAIPGPFVAPLASAFAGSAAAFRLCELPRTIKGKVAAAALTLAVVIAGIQWASNPNSLLSTKKYPNRDVPTAFPALMFWSAIILAAVWSNSARHERSDS
jgi:tetratricopeptide (TPR) repeat protein